MMMDVTTDQRDFDEDKRLKELFRDMAEECAERHWRPVFVIAVDGQDGVYTLNATALPLAHLIAIVETAHKALELRLRQESAEREDTA